MSCDTDYSYRVRAHKHTTGFYSDYSAKKEPTTLYLSTVDVTDLTPDTAVPGSTNVTIFSFTLNSCRSNAKIMSANIHYSGTNKNDLTNMKLWKESGTIPGGFDAGTDTLLGTATSGDASGKYTISFPDITIGASTRQFYVTSDIKGTATIGNTVDARILQGQIDITNNPDHSGGNPGENNWPLGSELATWDPAGSTLIAAPNQAPVANDDGYSTDEDTELNVAAAGVLENDTDADGNPLTAIKVADPSNGTLSLNADGSFTYAPFENYFGSDSFTYKADDGAFDSNTATVTIIVNSVNDPPSFDPIADRNINEDASSQDLPITNISPGPSDESGQTVTFTATSSDTSLIPNPTVSGSGATRTLSYAPEPNMYGSAIITVIADDGQTANNTYSRTFTVTVNSVNDPPVAVDDISSTYQNIPVDIAVLVNDTDAENNPLTPAIVDGPAHGAVLVNGDNTIQYTPTIDYHGSDSFTYKANDGDLDSNTATVSLTVIDNVSPTLTSAETQDTNNNGNIDAIKLTFNENINDDQLAFSGNDGWAADGYTVSNVDTGTIPNDHILLLNLVEGPTPDSGNTPLVTYTQIGGKKSTHDLAGNELASGSWPTTDGAKPVLLSAETQDVNGNGEIDAFKLTFSENIDGSVLTSGPDGWDVSGYDGESIVSGEIEDDNILILNFNEGISYDVNITPQISYALAESTHDLSGNELAPYSGTTTDKAAPTKPTASPGGGDYDSDQTVTLTTETGAEIRYTVDGTAPSATVGIVYSAPIVIGTDTVLKAVATDSAGNTSQVMTETYNIAPVISAETSSSATTTTVTITWTTDDPATSRVVYDTAPVSDATVATFPDGSNYGYANSTVEDATKVLDHSVSLTGLTAGITYYYRTVSHGSPEAVSNEQTFATTAISTAGGGGGGGGAGDGLSDGRSDGLSDGRSDGMSTAPPTSVLGAFSFAYGGEEILGTTTQNEASESALTPTPTPQTGEVLPGQTAGNPWWSWIIRLFTFISGLFHWK